MAIKPISNIANAILSAQRKWRLTSNVKYHSVVEGEDPDVSTVVDVVAPHDRVGVVLHPDAGQGVPTDLIVLVDSLKTRGTWVSIPQSYSSQNMSQHSSILLITEHESAFLNLTHHRTWVSITQSYSSQNISQHSSILLITEHQSAFFNLTHHRTWVSITQSYSSQNISQHSSILLITEHESALLNLTHHRTSVSIPQSYSSQNISQHSSILLITEIKTLVWKITPTHLGIVSDIQPNVLTVTDITELYVRLSARTGHTHRCSNWKGNVSTLTLVNVIGLIRPFCEIKKQKMHKIAEKKALLTPILNVNLFIFQWLF